MSYARVKLWNIDITPRVVKMVTLLDIPINTLLFL